MLFPKRSRCDTRHRQLLIDGPSGRASAATLARPAATLTRPAATLTPPRIDASGAASGSSCDEAPQGDPPRQVQRRAEALDAFLEGAAQVDRLLGGGTQLLGGGGELVEVGHSAPEHMSISEALQMGYAEVEAAGVKVGLVSVLLPSDAFVSLAGGTGGAAAHLTELLSSRDADIILSHHKSVVDVLLDLAPHEGHSLAPRGSTPHGLLMLVRPEDTAAMAAAAQLRNGLQAALAGDQRGGGGVGVWGNGAIHFSREGTPPLQNGAKTELYLSPLHPSITKGALLAAVADVLGKSDGKTRWLDEWSGRIDRWYMALPAATASGLRNCLGALSLHLLSRLDSALEALRLLGGGAPAHSSAPPPTGRSATQPGCEWIDEGVHRLPELPSFPEEDSETLRHLFERGLFVPVLRLLPTPLWDATRAATPSSWVAAARDDVEAVDAIKVAQSWTAVAGFGVAAGIAAGALAVVFWSRARQSRHGNQAMVRRRLQLRRSPTRAAQAAACDVELVLGG